MSDLNNIQEEGDSPSFLQLFWDLAVIDIKTRENATKQLLVYLREHSQSAEQPDYPGLSREMIYTLKRLTSGVCSSRDCARQGFSLALTYPFVTCILQLFPSVPLDVVYKMLMEASKVEGGMKRMEERDQYFGRIFGILSLFRSCRFLNDSPSETVTTVVENCAKEVVSLYTLKSWIRELCVQTISTMMKTVHPDLVVVILTQCRSLFEEVKEEESDELIVPIDLSPASLLLLLQIQIILHDRSISLNNPELTRLYINNPEITPSHLKTFMTLYKESSFTFPKLHPLWDTSIHFIQSLSSTPDVTLMEWWTAVTEQVLSTSPERKGMCLKVCQMLFPLVSSSMLPMLLNEKICTVISTNSGNSKNYLHEQTLHLLEFLVTSTENDKERRIALLNIFFSSVGMDFDQKTRSTTCKSLMESLTAEDMNTFITHCYGAFLQPLVNSDASQAKSTSEEETEKSDSEEEDIPTHRRIWALENISRLIMNNPAFDPFILVDFLFSISCIETEVKEASLPKDLSFLHTDFTKDLSYCSPALNDIVREKAKSVLFSTINSLAVKMDDKEKTRIGMNKENVLYVYIVLQHFETFNKRVAEMKNVTLLREWDEKEIASRKQLIDQIEAIHKRTVKNDQLKQDLMFERLFINLALEQVFKPDYTQFISDLIECYKQFTASNTHGKERPIAVLLDIVLILLRTSSKALRDTSIQLFGSVCSSMSEEDVSDILSVFWKDEGIEEEDDEEDMELSLDESDEEEEEENHQESEQPEIQEKTQEPEEPEEPEESSESEESEPDWERGLTEEEKEAMKQEDMAIANILRIKRDQERLKKESKTELINFKSRIIDLIETFVSKQPNHTAIGIVIVSLAEISQNLLKDKSEVALNTRISNILKNKISKSCHVGTPVLQNEEKLKEYMTKLVKLSEEVSLNDPIRRKQTLLCNATCLSVFVRSIQRLIFEVKDNKSKKGESIEKQVEKAQKLVSEVLDSAIQDFKSKRSHLNLLFFETLMSKCSLLCLSMIPTIQKIITEDTSINNYKKLEFLGMLTCLLRNTGNTPNHRGYEYVRRNEESLNMIYSWAKDKIDNREKEGYEDFRKLPRRKLLNDFIHAYENAKSAAEKRTDEKEKKEDKKEKKEREKMEKERQMKKTANNQRRLQKRRAKKLQEKMEQEEKK